jgi:hypothetical protein
MSNYNPFDWYWTVGDDDTRYWSSGVGGYVTILPPGSGVSRILNEAELSEVLKVYGLPGPTPTFPDLTSRQFWLALAITGHYDDVKASIELLDLEAQVEADKATSFERLHPLIVDLSPVLGLTESELNDLWLWASTL